MRFFSIILVLLMSSLAFSQSNKTDNYINTYKQIAIQEMHRTGIPASVTLAQGLLESNWGRSTLAVKGNNHFGIKCSGKWTGDSHYRYDDEYDKFGKKKKSCFRAYDHAEASFIDHSEFLTDPKKTKRYGFLFHYSSEDYSSWAHGLKKAGYASDPKYAHKLIQIIEKYNLNQYDSSLEEEMIVELQADFEYSIQYVNSCKVVLAKGGEDIKQLSDELGISSRKLLKYNEDIQKRSALLSRDDIVYLEEKRNYYLGEESKHLVEPGQDLAQISNLYGINVDYLRSINKLSDEQQPEQGESLLLSRYSGKKSKKRIRRSEPPSRELLVDNSNYLFDQALSPAKN